MKIEAENAIRAIERLAQSLIDFDLAPGHGTAILAQLAKFRNALDPETEKVETMSQRARRIIAERNTQEVA